MLDRLNPAKKLFCFEKDVFIDYLEDKPLPRIMKPLLSFPEVKNSLKRGMLYNKRVKAKQ